MIAGYSEHRPDGVTTALAIHLIVYCAVGACFAFALYALLQPTRTPNAGLTEYRPLPGTVVTYGEAFVAKSAPEPIGPIALVEPEPITTGRSIPEPEQLKRAVTAPSQPHTAKRLQRNVRVENPKRRTAACIPGYDSSGAQTRPC